MHFEDPPRFMYFIAGFVALLITAGIALLVNWLLTFFVIRILVAIFIGSIIALPFGGCTIDAYIMLRRSNAEYN